METNLRCLMSLHFSLVACYYDNKDSFGASRSFYLQRSLLYVIAMYVHRRVCHLYIKMAHSYVVTSPTMKTLFMLFQVTVPIVAFFVSLIVTSQ